MTRSFVTVRGRDGHASTSEALSGLALALEATHKPVKVASKGVILTEAVGTDPAALPTPVLVDRDSTGRVTLPGVPGLNVVQVAVADGQGRSAAATLTFVLARAMTATVSPTRIALGVETDITVTVTDSVTGQPVGTMNGRVLINGVDVGPVGAPFRHRFSGGGSGPLVTTLQPICEARVPGYAPAQVVLTFYRPVRPAFPDSGGFAGPYRRIGRDGGDED